MSTYWQIAAGSVGRDYTDEFIRFGMAFVGGFDQERTLMDEVKPGDWILLKHGQRQIRAVGRVAIRNGKHNGKGDKEWLLDFDGWELPSYCYVDWQVPKSPQTVSGLTRATIEKVWKPDIIEQAKRLLQENPEVRKPEEEPPPQLDVKDEEIIEDLIKKGLRIAAAEELTHTFSRIRRLAKYYNSEVGWEHTREHEARTFLVVPLLLALGWSEQTIKIELPTKGGRGRGRVDLALFGGPFKNNMEDCIAIIETKGFAQGLSYAPSQALEYTNHFPNCNRMFVTNGYCYKAYQRKGGEKFPPKPFAYLNILKPKKVCPLDPSVAGCLEILDLLLRKP